jgi:hypothetical protein
MRPRPPGTQVRSAGKVAFQPQPSELKDEVWIRLLLEDYEENSHDAEKNIWFPYSGARSMPTGDSWEGLCRTHWLERSIIARRRPSAMNWPNMPAPAYLGDFYRRVAMRYLSMAQDILRQARERGDIVPKRSGSTLRT